MRRGSSSTFSSGLIHFPSSFHSSSLHQPLSMDSGGGGGGGGGEGGANRGEGVRREGVENDEEGEREGGREREQRSEGDGGGGSSPLSSFLPFLRRFSRYG